MIRPYLLPLPLLAMAEAFAQAPQAAPAADLGGSMWQMFLGLALVLALMVGSLWVLKKLVTQRGENAGLLRVVAGTAVGARERVVIVEVGSTWLVLGVAPGRVSALAEVPRQSGAVQPAATAPPPRRGISRLAAQSDAEEIAMLARLLACALLLVPMLADAQVLPAVTSSPAAGGGTQWSLSIQTLLLLTSLTFLPALLLMMTSFTRIIIVLSLLRHALGTQTSPPNQVLVGLALFLTFFIMTPVTERIYADAYLPLSENKLSFQGALEKGAVPLRAFMLKQVREADLATFTKVAKLQAPAKADEIPMRVLVPAFVTSELKTAFQIGFIVFIPFLIIDMVVASVLMSMGMMMMSPVIVALPFKIMLFVLVDGWNLLIGSLVLSFG